MSSKQLIAAVSAVGILFVGAAYAQEEPQVLRQELMERNGQATGKMGAMVKGEADFDAAVVIESLETIQEVATEFPQHFPEGSETGHETRALPAIWENKEDFEARAAKLATDAEAAIAAAPTDVATLTPLFETVTGNCGGCHELYRAPEN